MKTEVKRKVKTVSQEEFRDRLKRLIREEIANHLKEMNPYHSPRDGTFTTEKESGCDSLYFVDGSRSSRKGSLSNKHIAGRGPDKSGRGKKRRCYDDSVIKEMDMDVLLDEVAKNMPSKKINVEKLKRNCRSIGLRSVGEFLDLIDAIESAKAGKRNMPAKA